jgi:SAM-dependent methyltransferase
MRRRCEPELMDAAGQAAAYAAADFSAAHEFLVAQLPVLLPGARLEGLVVDLGCGPADVTVRFARAHPAARFDGVDGAEAMLALGRARVAREDLAAHIALHRRRLPGDGLPQARYDAIVSNSLLHHLHRPAGMWALVRRALVPGGVLYVTDLRRPSDVAARDALVARHATGDAPVLRRDFAASLAAAFTPGELRRQLDAAGLRWAEVTPLGDRHLAVYGRAPQA